MTSMARTLTRFLWATRDVRARKSDLEEGLTLTTWRSGCLRGDVLVGHSGKIDNDKDALPISAACTLSALLFSAVLRVHHGEGAESISTVMDGISVSSEVYHMPAIIAL